jgi:gamma-glutamyltranspeptidase/glutathione hydrolase
VLYLGLLLPAEARPQEPSRPPSIDRAWPFWGKTSHSEGRHGLVVSGSPIASRVGRDILRQGGNAIDAAVAVGFALAVVHPEAGNLGGGGFILIRLADGTTRALDYRETAPHRASHDMFLDPSGQPTEPSQIGHLAAGVPGSVAGLVEAERRFGRLPLARVVKPALALARQGFVIDVARHRSLERDSSRLARFPSTRAVFLPGGRPPAIGRRFRQPDLARTLDAVRRRGADGFYRGWVADSLVAEMARGGGLIDREDLAAYRPVWREPLEVGYHGYRVVLMPPPSSGGVTLAEILNLMGGFAPLPGFGTAPLLHREAEAMRRAFSDRNIYLGDPDFVTMPLGRLLSATYADSLRATIDTARATRTPPPPPLPDGGSTTHYAVVDRDGNAVSATTTLNNSFGSQVTVRGAGFLLNDTMDDFAVAPGRPNQYGLVQGEANAVEPGKRMLSAMTPTIVLDPEGRVYLLLGAAGGPRIITAVYQVLSNLIDHGWPLDAAVAAPRIHDQGLPDELVLERGGFPAATIAGLRAMGHLVREHEPFAEVQAIARARKGWQGASDPRRGGGGAGY